MYLDKLISVVIETKGDWSNIYKISSYISLSFIYDKMSLNNHAKTILGLINGAIDRNLKEYLKGVQLNSPK